MKIRIVLLAFMAICAFGMSGRTPSATPDYKTEPTTLLLGHEGGSPVHFAWGAEIGSAIDLTSNDMTYTSLGAYFGFKNSWCRFAGIGVEINSMLNNSSRCYPVYGMFRTSFSSQPRFLFMDLRAGVSFNNMLEYDTQTDFYGSLGCGFTLAHGRKFSSHIILSYVFMPMHAPGVTAGEEPKNWGTSLHLASIRIGCSF